MLKALFFNLNGTITDLSKFHFLAWKSTFSHYGIVFGNGNWKDLCHHSRNYIIEHTLAEAKIERDEVLIEKISAEKNELYKALILSELKPSDVHPNILKIIGLAKSKDLKVCVISHSANTKLIIERLGLANAFDFVCAPEKVSDEEVATQKIGSSAITESIIRILKTTGFKGDECIGFENTDDGIREFNLFNIFSVAVTNFNPEIGKDAMVRYNSIIDINLEEIIFKYYSMHNENE